MELRWWQDKRKRRFAAIVLEGRWMWRQVKEDGGQVRDEWGKWIETWSGWIHQGEGSEDSRVIKGIREEWYWPWVGWCKLNLKKLHRWESGPCSTEAVRTLAELYNGCRTRNSERQSCGWWLMFPFYPNIWRSRCPSSHKHPGDGPDYCPASSS